MCVSPVAGDIADHAHTDAQCSTAEITNHYYAAEEEEHLRPSPTHRSIHTHAHTHSSISLHEELIRAHFSLFSLAFWHLCLNTNSFTANGWITCHKIKVLGKI